MTTKVSACPCCDKPLGNDFRFCPQCGHDLAKPTLCANCQCPNPGDSRFCQQCGTALHPTSSHAQPPKAQSSGPAAPAAELPPPPAHGITIEFPWSTSQSFDFAVAAARKFPGFIQQGQDKKAVYRVTITPGEMAALGDLIEHLKGWRRRAVYMDGEKVTWDSVFSFSWCYERKKASFKPDMYCFGYEQEWDFNVWGCFQAHLPFTENAPWFCWGTWLNASGDWRFNKERIKHELQKNLYPFRCCPALQPAIIDEVLKALPDIVNPAKDKDWAFVEQWGDDGAPVITVSMNRYGEREQVAVRGVAPRGRGALTQLAKRARLRLPDPGWASGPAS